MTYTLAILRIPPDAYRAVEAALIKAGDEGMRRVNSPSSGHLNLDGVALEVDPSWVREDNDPEHWGDK